MNQKAPYCATGLGSEPRSLLEPGLCVWFMFSCCWLHSRVQARGTCASSACWGASPLEGSGAIRCLSHSWTHSLMYFTKFRSAWVIWKRKWGKKKGRRRTEKAFSFIKMLKSNRREMIRAKKILTRCISGCRRTDIFLTNYLITERRWWRIKKPGDKIKNS